MMMMMNWQYPASEIVVYIHYSLSDCCFYVKKIRYGCRGLSNLVPLILFIYVNVLLFYKAEMTSDRIRTFFCIYEQKLRAVISGGVVF